MWSIAALETGGMLLICFVLAGWLAPDVNEAHYLTKARHYWNPEWCPGDHFLESADAHWVFYWCFGWITRFMSLPVAAWIGRVLTWLLLAWSWGRLSWSLVPRRLFSVFTFAALACLVQRAHFAGEWIVGGVEAKGFAFAFVFLGLEAWVRSRWSTAILLMGAASAFHVLTGGWSLVACFVAWVLLGRERPRLGPLTPAILGAGLLAVPGLIPGLLLTMGASGQVVREAHRIYVYERLGHHLVFHQIFYAEHGLYAVRFGILLACWMGVLWYSRRDAAHWRLQSFVAGAVGIALAGVAIDQATLEFPEVGAALLRFYWFRLSDAMVPLGCALALGQIVMTWEQPRPAVAAWILMACLVLMGWSMAAHARQRLGDFRPPGEIQASPLAGRSPAEARQKYEDWVRACRWIEQNTPAGARFLTPRVQQTFKWYAERSEVATGKDVPQDAVSLVQWRARMDAIYTPLATSRGLSALGESALVTLAKTYGATHALVERSPGPGLQLRRLYPLPPYENESYEIYALE